MAVHPSCLVALYVAHPSLPGRGSHAVNTLTPRSRAQTQDLMQNRTGSDIYTPGGLNGGPPIMPGGPLGGPPIIPGGPPIIPGGPPIIPGGPPIMPGPPIMGPGPAAAAAA